MPEDKDSKPLVTVGIPTYNRPEGLRRTLECMTRQTYTNLEIIVSDNSASNKEPELVVRELMQRDPRIQYFKQDRNKGYLNNYNFVLEKASGKYFMWAADDDKWALTFIETLVEILQSGEPNYVAAIMEVQYTIDNMKCEFFKQGGAFYKFHSKNRMKRLEYMIKCAYDNLIYSLFDREILQKAGKIYFSRLDWSKITMNEIPLYLYVLQYGNWRVLPKIGMYKKTNRLTYENIKWEFIGGKKPISENFSYAYYYHEHLNYILKYHLFALRNVFLMINHLKLKYWQKLQLKMLSSFYIMKHFCYFIFRRKGKHP